MQNLDLDIDNYSLDDLLNLFNLSWNFSEDQLKDCKKMVLMTHPDKSKLEPKFFIFFKKAYSILYKVYTSKQYGKNNETREDFFSEDDEKFILKFKKHKNFNKIFNELFDKHHRSQDDGYSDWLKSDEDITNSKVSNMRDVNTEIERQKKLIRTLVKTDAIQSLEYGNHTTLDQDKPNYYSSDIFSTLQYEDVKRAHVESVIPVSQEDYEMKKKYNSVIEMQIDRDSQKTDPLSVKQSKDYLSRQNEEEDYQNTQRIFNLTREAEKAEERNRQILGQFKQLIL